MENVKVCIEGNGKKVTFVVSHSSAVMAQTYAHVLAGLLIPYTFAAKEFEPQIQFPNHVGNIVHVVTTVRPHNLPLLCDRAAQITTLMLTYQP